MKNILIPYDFTESAKPVSEYGLRLAEELSASVILLHVMPFPVVTPETGLPAFSYKELKEDSLKELHKIAEQFKKQFASIHKIECCTDMGDVTESIVEYCHKEAIDFVIMGIHQHGNKLMKLLMGSNAVQTAHKIKCTVIIVPPGVTYKTPKVIAFASDKNATSLDPAFQKARQMSEQWQAELEVLQIVPEKHHLTPGEMVVNNYFERAGQRRAHKLVIVTEKKVSEGLLGTLGNQLIDLIILEPKEHNLFYKMFHESVSRELAFASPVPVMLIHSEPAD